LCCHRFRTAWRGVGRAVAICFMREIAASG
jgi:hypothetical protein